MNSLNVFIHVSEEMISKLYQSIYWTDTIFKLKTRIKSIQKILAVFQYPHLIEAITWIDFLPVWLYSLHESSQTVSDMYKKLFVEKGEAFVVFFSEYGFLWSFVIQYKLEKSSCSLLSRVFNDEINDLWSAKYSSLS
jgi:hypothetical protein